MESEREYAGALRQLAERAGEECEAYVLSQSGDWVACISTVFWAGDENLERWRLLDKANGILIEPKQRADVRYKGHIVASGFVKSLSRDEGVFTLLPHRPPPARDPEAK